MTSWLAASLATTLVSAATTAPESAPAPTSTETTMSVAPEAEKAAVASAAPQPAGTAPTAAAAPNEPNAASSVSASPPPPATVPVPVTAAPVTAAPPVPPRPALPESGVAMIATGFGTFGTLYALTALAGAATIDEGREIGRDEFEGGNGVQTTQRGQALLVPVAGPFIAMRFTESARRRYFLALNGGIQLAGVVLGAVGVVQERKRQRAKRARLTASASPDGATVGVHMRF